MSSKHLVAQREQTTKSSERTSDPGLRPSPLAGGGSGKVGLPGLGMGGAGGRGGSRPAAAIPMENPHCSCKLTRHG